MAIIMESLIKVKKVFKSLQQHPQNLLYLQQITLWQEVKGRNKLSECQIPNMGLLSEAVSMLRSFDIWNSLNYVLGHHMFFA